MNEQDYAIVTDAPPLTTDARRRSVQAVLDQAVSKAKILGIIAEVRTGEDRWFGSAGVADLATGRERTAEERFYIGSTTKAFVATLLLQLVAEHRLRVDDEVEKWLPGILQGNGYDGSGITIRQLLSHTSGIFNYLDDREGLSQFGNPSPAELVQVAVSHPPAFQPGTDWGYCNTNYILAGMIIEQVAGAALAESISERISRPLGLAGTYLPHPGQPNLETPHARHYSKMMQPDSSAGCLQDVTELDAGSLFWAGGGMVSTVGDLVGFFSALFGGRILPAGQLEEMLTTVPTKNWIPNTTYGLGISSVDLGCGVTLWGMGGALPGSWSYTYGTKDGTRMLATNVNSDDVQGGWESPIEVFTDLLQAGFCPPGFVGRPDG